MPKIFLKTREHDGSFYEDSIGLSRLGEMYLNVCSVERIIRDLKVGVRKDGTEIKHSLTFFPIQSKENELIEVDGDEFDEFEPRLDSGMFSFCFSQEGIGEYHRLKRDIESLTESTL